MSRIAICSDSHDNIWHMETALAQMQAAGCDTLLHCGDLCAPFMIKQLAEGFAGEIHLVFGNNDGDGRLLQVLSSQFGHVTHHGPYAEIQVDGKQIAIIHYPRPAQRIAEAGVFDVVCYGHDHTRSHQMVGATHLLNPGEVMGKDHTPTWALYDTTSNDVRFIEITK